MIGERFNFEDVFFRDLTVCVLDTLEGQIKWLNRFSSGDKFVQVPFYYSLTGDERFLLDSFQDDIVSENRFVDGKPNGSCPHKNRGDRDCDPPIHKVESNYNVWTIFLPT
jgi:hypothetical protein